MVISNDLKDISTTLSNYSQRKVEKGSFPGFNELTKRPGMEQTNFQKVNGEFKIGTLPNEKCMTTLTELKSLTSVAERNAIICVATVKSSECSGREASTQFHQGNTEVAHEVMKRQVKTVTIQRTWTPMYNVSNYVLCICLKPMFLHNRERPCRFHSWSLRDMTRPRFSRHL